jgi:mRNA-degrading endonuclease toxin of MazEF toxin-antitoxin module
VVEPAHPLRGQIWEHVRGSHQYRVLIISNDAYNELPEATPWALTVERDAPGIPGYVVPLGDHDPLPGAVVVIPRVLRCDATALRRCLGFLTDSTLRTVDEGLREFLDVAQ